MFEINPENAGLWSKNETPRSMFGKTLTEMAKADPRIVLLVADSGRMCKAENTFAPACPKQYVECGISEQNMMGVAAGLAHAGKKPVAFAFSPFATERCLEQVRLDIAYAGLGVTIVGADAGIAQATLGVTHYGWEDAAIMRAIPGMTVMCPADNGELVKSLEAAVNLGKPVYLRLTGGGGKPRAIYRADYPFEIGKSVVLREGGDVWLLVSGTLAGTVLDAADILEKAGVSAGVADVHTLKPLDNDAVANWAKKARLLATVEEHTVLGGLGTAVAEALSECPGSCPLLRLGLPDQYPKHVSRYPAMAASYGLTAQAIAQRVLGALQKL